MIIRLQDNQVKGNIFKCIFKVIKFIWNSQFIRNNLKTINYSIINCKVRSQGKIKGYIVARK